jgi:predicted TIM-barrel fold metal-dependent hydrolase
MLVFEELFRSSYYSKYFIGRYGHEKILFGSDFPFGHPVSELTNVLNLRITEEAKESIFSSNIVRLLNQVER